MLTALYCTVSAHAIIKTYWHPRKFQQNNIVGYQTINRAAAFACYGSAFVKPGQTTYSLAELDIAWTAASPALKNQATSRRNFIQFFSTANALRLDSARCYYKCLADGKWYVKDTTSISSASNDTEVADPSTITFNAGEGFLCNFGTASAKITFNGEVITGGESKTLTLSRPAAFFVAGNPCANAITLNDIDITWTAASPALKNQATSRRNFIQFFSTANALRLDADRCYYKCLADGKWYKKDTSSISSASNDIEIAPSTISIAAGEGFLCNFGTASAKITMPTSL